MRLINKKNVSLILIWLKRFSKPNNLPIKLQFLTTTIKTWPIFRPPVSTLGNYFSKQRFHRCILFLLQIVIAAAPPPNLHNRPTQQSSPISRENFPQDFTLETSPERFLVWKVLSEKILKKEGGYYNGKSGPNYGRFWDCVCVWICTHAHAPELFKSLNCLNYLDKLAHSKIVCTASIHIYSQENKHTQMHKLCNYLPHNNSLAPEFREFLVKTPVAESTTVGSAPRCVSYSPVGHDALLAVGRAKTRLGEGGFFVCQQEDSSFWLMQQ